MSKPSLDNKSSKKKLQFSHNSQDIKMSEKYLQIGVPMTQLPRPVTSGHYNRIESALSNPSGNAVKFHDCYHNSNMTNLRDIRDSVRKRF